MGTPGIPFQPEKSALVASIMRNRGILTRVAKEFDVDDWTIHKHVRCNPEYKEILDQARQLKDEFILDIAEENMVYFLSKYHKSNTKVSQDATKYALDRKGEKRGYKKGVEDAIAAVKSKFEAFDKSVREEGEKSPDKED